MPGPRADRWHHLRRDRDWRQELVASRRQVQAGAQGQALLHEDKMQKVSRRHRGRGAVRSGSDSGASFRAGACRWGSGGSANHRSSAFSTRGGGSRGRRGRIGGDGDSDLSGGGDRGLEQRARCSCRAGASCRAISRRRPNATAVEQAKAGAAAMENLLPKLGNGSSTSAMRSSGNAPATRPRSARSQPRCGPVI